jgi:hypothetical protein
VTQEQDPDFKPQFQRGGGRKGRRVRERERERERERLWKNTCFCTEDCDSNFGFSVNYNLKQMLHFSSLNIPFRRPQVKF